MKKHYALIGLLVLQALSARSQDAHFSQYFVAPLSVNPGLTGFMDGTARAMVNHRSQWSSLNNAFSTTTASLDGIILQSKLPAGDRLGVGLQLMSDRVADGLLTNNYVSASTAYHKSLDKEGNYSIGVGLQGTYAQRSIDGTKLLFDDQLDPYGQFSQTSKDAGSGNNGLRRNYFDASAGIVFKARFNERNQFYIGASAFHLASPKVTFMNNTLLTVPTRLTINGVYEARLADMFSISLLGLYTKQEEASEAVLGTIMTIGRSYREFDKTPIFYVGLLYRTNDAYIPYIAAEYWDLRFGFSYDINSSALSAATKGQGGIEASLVYLLRIPPNKKIQYLCPNNPKF
jgi:type IX secretion system PorP/SprF family membrane protein